MTCPNVDPSQWQLQRRLPPFTNPKKDDRLMDEWTVWRKAKLSLSILLLFLTPCLSAEAQRSCRDDPAIINLKHSPKAEWINTQRKCLSRKWPSASLYKNKKESVWHSAGVIKHLRVVKMLNYYSYTVLVNWFLLWINVTIYHFRSWLLTGPLLELEIVISYMANALQQCCFSSFFPSFVCFNQITVFSTL